MTKLIESISSAVARALQEVITLGQSLKKRATDVLATLTAPAQATDPPRRSTDDWSTSAAVPPSDDSRLYEFERGVSPFMLLIFAVG
jgi:hypothetical protein